MRWDRIIKVRKIAIVLISLLIFGLPIGLHAVQNIMLGQAGRPIYLLTVTGSGTGTGTITSDIYGINCTSTAGVESGVCSAQIPMGTTVVLTATPVAGNMFNGWTGSGCSGTGTCSVVISGNMTVNAEFLNIPLAGMWFWGRINEGSGTTIIDYAGVENGRVVDAFLAVPNAAQLNVFWNTNPGFGTQQIGVNFAKAYRLATVARAFRYISFVMFLNPNNSCSGIFAQDPCFLQVGENGAINLLRLQTQCGVAPNWWKLNNTYSAVLSASGGTWYCAYGFSQAATNNVGLHIRQSGGAFQDTGINYVSPANGNQQVIQTAQTNDSITGVIGDVLVWASNTPEGIISPAQANGVYESLRARYGML